jgi:hypothetical protein
MTHFPLNNNEGQVFQYNKVILWEVKQGRVDHIQ